MDHSRSLFSLFLAFQQLTVNLFKSSQWLGFEPRASDIGRNHSANWATTTVFSLSLIIHFCLHPYLPVGPSLTATVLVFRGRYVTPKTLGQKLKARDAGRRRRQQRQRCWGFSNSVFPRFSFLLFRPTTMSCTETVWPDAEIKTGPNFAKVA